MKKKFLALLLAFTFMLSLCSCDAFALTKNVTELEKGTYSLVSADDGDTYWFILAKRLTVLDDDGDVLVDEAKLKYDDDNERFTVDGTKAFTVTKSLLGSQMTLTVIKKDALGMPKGEYSLALADESDAPEAHRIYGRENSSVDTEIESDAPAEQAQEAQAETPAGYCPAVDFYAYDILTGQPVSSDIFCQYDITMMNFWEPWCSPCVEEMPELERLYEDLTASGYSVLIIGVYSTGDGVMDVLESAGTTYPVIQYCDGFVFLDSGYVPNTVFFNREGQLICEGNADMEYRYIGSRSYDEWMTIIECLIEAWYTA